MTLKDHPTLAYWVIFLGVCGHASSEFFAVLSGVAGPEVSVWRYTLGSFGLVVIALLSPQSRDLWTPIKAEWRRLLSLGLFGISVTYLAFHWALDFATVIQVGTFVTTMPIFIGLINARINRTPMGMPKIISGGCAVVGIGLLLTDGVLAHLAGSGQQMIGLALVFVCAFFGSAYAVLAKPLINTYGVIRITTITLSIGGVGLWLIVGAMWGRWVNPATIFAMPETARWSLLTLALFNTTITQILFFGGLAAVPDITRGGYLFFLKPVITAVLALAFLSQPITWIQALAIVAIVGSVGAEVLVSKYMNKGVTGQA